MTKVKLKKISADLHEDANELLNALVSKHERSKGWLLSKMIRTFCNEEVAVKSTQVAVIKKESVKRFARPTPFEIYEYMIERGVENQEQSNSFYDFYESKGWLVGKVKMKCWKAAVRNWLKGYKEKSGGKDILQLSADSNWEDGINEIF